VRKFIIVLIAAGIMPMQYNVVII